MWRQSGFCSAAQLARALAKSCGACAVATFGELKFPAELPKLNYPVEEGIKPVLSPRQLELHYAKHHKAYVDKLNLLAKDKGWTSVKEIMHATYKDKNMMTIFNQAAQHFNHTLYWYVLTPNGTQMPASLEKAIKVAFGSVDKFKDEFQKMGINNFGSGWTWLCVNPKEDNSLVLINTGNAGCPLVDGYCPIFTADVWEHAYYKDFENRRPDYLAELWKVVNWENVSKLYELAVKNK